MRRLEIGRIGQDLVDAPENRGDVLNVRQQRQPVGIPAPSDVHDQQSATGLGKFDGEANLLHGAGRQRDQASATKMRFRHAAKIELQVERQRLVGDVPQCQR